MRSMREAIVDEIDGGVARNPDVAELRGAGRRRVAASAEVGMRAPDAPRADAPDFAERSVTGKAENVEEVVHGAQPGQARRASGRRASRQFAPSAVVERIEIERAVALVTQHLDQRRPALFLRRLELAIGDPQQMHLQGLDQKFSAFPQFGHVRGKITTPFRAGSIARTECIASTGGQA